MQQNNRSIFSPSVSMQFYIVRFYGLTLHCASIPDTKAPGALDDELGDGYYGLCQA